MAVGTRQSRYRHFDAGPREDRVVDLPDSGAAGAGPSDRPVVVASALRNGVGECFDFECVFANPAACRSTRSNRDDLIGTRLGKVLPVPWTSQLLAGLVGVLATGHAMEFPDLVATTGAGPDRHHAVRAWKVDDGVGVTWREITGQSVPEPWSPEARERLILAMANAPIGMSLTSPEGRFLVVNQPLCEFFGIGEDELLTHSWQDLTHPDDLAADLAQLARVTSGEVETYRLAKRFRHADGSLRYGDVTVSAVRTAVGEVQYLVSQVLDNTLVEATARALTAERARTAAESRYRALVAALGDGIVLHDSRGRIVEANASAERILGLTREQMQGRTPLDPIWQVIGEDGTDLPGAEHPAMVALRTGQAVRDVVMGVRKPDGRRTWIIASAELIEEPSGSPAVIATFTDITTHHEQIAAAESLFRNCVGVLPEPFFLFTAKRAADGTVTDLIYQHLNAAAETLYGWPASEVIGRGLLEVFPSVRELGVFDCYIEPLRTGSPASMRVPKFAENAVVGAFDVTAAAFGEQVVVTARDITTELAAQEALAQSEEQYRLLAQNASDVVLVTGPDHNLSWVSPTVRETLGWAPEELLGTRVSDLMHPVDSARYEDDRRAFRSGANPTPPDGYLFRMRTREGSYRWLSGAGRPLTDPSGRPAGVVAGLRDVTELMAARAQAEAIAGSMLDPHIVLSAVRDTAGTIVDFEYTEANPAACAYNKLTRQELLGRRLLDLLPGHSSTGMFAAYARVVETGDPLILDDMAYAPEFLGEMRFFDVRAVKLGDGLSYIWRDVTDRHIAAEALAASEEHLRMLVENATDVVLRASADGVVQWVSNSVTRSLGWQPEELLGLTVMDLLHPDEQGLALEAYGAVQAGNPRGFEARVRTAAGGHRWIAATVHPLFDADGEVVGRVSGWRDIHREHQIREALAASEARYRLVADNTYDVVQRSRDGVVSWVSPSITTELGWAPEEWVGHHLNEFLDPAERGALTADWAAPGASGSSVNRLRVRARSGAYHWVETHTKEVLDSQGNPDGAVCTFRTIDNEVRSEQELHRRATTDDLTDLLKREEALARLAEITQGSRRHPGKACAVIFADVDDFKGINDRHGHGGGDLWLRETAARIRASVRAGDLVARMGGDEFLIILDAVHNLGEAVAIADKIRTAVSRPVPGPSAVMQASLSLGVTLTTRGESVDTLISRADRAMYKAKRYGRDQVVPLSPPESRD